MRNREIDLFVDRLHTLLLSGASVDDALGQLAETAELGRHSAVIAIMRAELVSGDTLSNVVERRRDLLGPRLCNLLVVGDELDAVGLLLAHDHRWRVERGKLQRHWLRALSTPAAALTFVGVMGLLAVTFLVPVFESAYAPFGRLPAATTWLFGAMRVIRDGLVPVGVLSAVGLWAARGGHLDRFAEPVHRLGTALLRNVGVSGLLAAARTSRILATLCSRGVPLQRALHIAAVDSSDPTMTNALVRAQLRLQSGRSVHDAFVDATANRAVFELLRVGAQTNWMPAAMEATATALDQRAAIRAAELARWTAPFLLVGLAIAASLFGLIGIYVPFAGLFGCGCGH